MARGSPFSLEELQDIEVLLKRNTPIPRIARALGRSIVAVRQEIQTHGGVLRYSAEESFKERRSRQRKPHSPRYTSHMEGVKEELASRIDILEEQIKILTQVIRSYVKHTIHN